MPATFRVLAATDGSPSAHAALLTALEFPWPKASRARAVVALGHPQPRAGRPLRAAAARALHEQLEPARRLLARRWPDADGVALHDVPVGAILAEARRFRADAIALGWRGHGALRRLLAGSVSRAVVAQAARPVLVARTAAGSVQRFIVGFDGSAEAQRAVRFLARLEPRRGSVATVVTVTEPVWVPRATRRLPASARASLRSEALRFDRKRAELAQARADAAASLLKRAGWTARTQLRAGAPLEMLLAASADLHGDVVVAGARGAGGLTRALLGSVASGALNHSRIPVLIVP
jgi:nucleotide-binding universal stress UspA family protein